MSELWTTAPLKSMGIVGRRLDLDAGGSDVEVGDRATQDQKQPEILLREKERHRNGTDRCREVRPPHEPYRNL